MWLVHHHGPPICSSMARSKGAEDPLLFSSTSGDSRCGLAGVCWRGPGFLGESSSDGESF